MSDDNRFGGNPGTPAGGAGQDFGFFASSPVAAPSQFGGLPAQAPAPARPVPAAARPVAPPPVVALPSQPAPAQFGPPPGAPMAPPASYGPAPGYLAPPPYPPVQRSGLPVWAIVAICVPAGLVVLGILAAIAIPVFLNQRSTPVAPQQLGGLTMTTDPQLKNAVSSVRDELARHDQNVKTSAAGYGTLTDGFVLMAFNARVDPAREFRDLGATTPPQSFGNVQCATNTTDHASMCLRTSLRGSVEVAAFGDAPDFTRLAAVTDEAWSAQPYAN
jgi:hypothetical protein